MDASLRGGLHKLAIALAYLWFFPSDSSWIELFVYSSDLDTTSPRLDGKRIKIRLEIEDNPTLDIEDIERAAAEEDRAADEGRDASRRRRWG